jgi:hypothetical protein
MVMHQVFGPEHAQAGDASNPQGGGDRHGGGQVLVLVKESFSLRFELSLAYAVRPSPSSAAGEMDMVMLGARLSVGTLQAPGWKDAALAVQALAALAEQVAEGRAVEAAAAAAAAAEDEARADREARERAAAQKVVDVAAAKRICEAVLPAGQWAAGTDILFLKTGASQSRGPKLAAQATAQCNRA